MYKWCRAVDVPSWKPKFFNYKPTKPEKFEKFDSIDNKAIESAWKQGKNSQVVMSDGLFTVDIKNRLLQPTYWQGPKFKVIRGTWFKRPSMQPLDEDLAAKLEDLWRRYSTNMNGSSAKEVKLDNQVIVFDKKDGVVTATCDGSMFDSIRSLGQGKFVYVRGYHPKPSKSPLPTSIPSSIPVIGQATKEETEPTGEATNDRDRPIKHLIFCIHGIGQKLGARFDFVSFIKDTGALRGNLNKAFALSPDVQKVVGSKINNKIQVLPVLWRQNWEFNPGHTDTKLKGLSPQSVFYRDNVLADAVLDFVMYTQPNIRKEIYRVTIDLINTEFKRFCELNPEFAADPKVSIVGHSLGSVIADDLHRMKESPFPFETENLFFLGSPVGILDLINEKSFSKTGSSAKNIYNIMRPSDPIAARLEPMVIGNRAKETVPLMLNRNDDSFISSVVDGISQAMGYTTRFANNVAENVNSVWQTISSALVHDVTKPDGTSLKPVPESTMHSMDQDLKAFNRHHRLDFSIPESLEISLALGLTGHMTYLESPTVASFILREIYRVGESKSGVIMEVVEGPPESSGSMPVLSERESIPNSSSTESTPKKPRNE